MKTKTQISTMKVRQCNASEPIVMVAPSQVDNVFPPSYASRVDEICYDEGGPTAINRCIAGKTKLTELPISPSYGFTYYRITDDGRGGYTYSSRESAADDRVAYGLNPTKYAVTLLDGPSASEVAQSVYGSALRVYELGNPRIMNVPLAVAELKDTPGTLKSARDLIKFVVQSPTNRAIELGQGTLRAAASAYLAYNFGIKPSVRDVELYLKQFRGANATIRRKPVKRLKGETIRAKVKLGPNLAKDYIPSPAVRTSPFSLSPSPSEFGDVGIIASNLAGNWPSLHVYETASVEGVVFGRFTREEVEADGVPLSSERIAFPYFGTAWALCPFSFLFDWVWDVSTYLEQIERAMVLKQRRVLFDEGLWTSIRRSSTTYVPRLYQNHSKVVTNWNPRYGYLTVGYTVVRGVSGYEPVVDVIDYERTPYSQLLPPVPWASASFKAYQLNTAAALCVQFLPVLKQARRFCMPHARLSRRMRRIIARS